MTQRKRKHRSSGRRKVSPPRLPPKSAALPRTDETPPPPTSPISESLYDFARQLKDDRSKKKAEYPLSWLVAPVLEADQANVLETLAFILERWPDYLYLHPVIREQIDHLYRLVLWHGPPDIYDRNKAWLVRLVEAWAKGMTFGYYSVQITPPKGRPGQVSSLFPHLGEREGDRETLRAELEKQSASLFRASFDALRARLKAIQWRVVRQEYKEFLQSHKDSKHVVEPVAADIGQIFEGFLRDSQRAEGQPLSEEALREIARRGLEVPLGRDPRHKVTCELFGRLDFEFQGITKGTSPQLIESTLRTLRKHGIS